MLIEKLFLTQFKNYKICSLSFSPKINFIVGNNGNGKTNLLEAISMLCFTKSFLLNSDDECVMLGENYFNIRGEFNNLKHNRKSVQYNYDKSGSEKKILINKELLSKYSEHIGTIPVVILSPKDIVLTTGSPSERRRNFDILISQASPVYLDNLRKYSRTLKQKNSLLKESLQTDSLEKVVDGWNEKLAEYGSQIIKKRLQFTSEMQILMDKIFPELVDNYQPIIKYVNEQMDYENKSDENLQSAFYECLKNNFRDEVSRKLSLAGIQRDDFQFSMIKNGEEFAIRNFASQGEHKTFLIALKLCEFEYLKGNLMRTTEEVPIMLFDDIFSELDGSRISRFAKLVNRYGQVFITTANNGTIMNFNNGGINESSTIKVEYGAASYAN